MKRIKADELILSVFVVIALLVGGCITTPDPVKPDGAYYDVKVESIALPDADLKNKTYVLASALKNVSANDIQFREFARYIENALSKNGYKCVGSKDADLVIRLAYGVGKPKTEINTKASTTSGGYSYQVGWTWIHVPPTTRTVTTKNTTYNSFMMLEAYDSKDKRSQLWRTEVTSKGWGHNLRKILPRMIAVATYIFGTDTMGGYKTARIYDNDPRVLDIMRSSDTHSEDAFTETPRLGVMLELMTHQDMPYLPDYKQHAGVLVTSVAENSVAQIMGIRKYDIILTVNNKIVKNPAMLVEEIQNTKSGGKIQLTFFSWNKLRDVPATGHLK